MPIKNPKPNKHYLCKNKGCSFSSTKFWKTENHEKYCEFNTAKKTCKICVNYLSADGCNPSNNYHVENENQEDLFTPDCFGVCRNYDYKFKS